ncbi:MAG: SIMPL domain-containing protein [Bacteroidales bacterium]|nr:SIMPL domain-containing protein [Bacteroidales bacterium]
MKSWIIALGMVGLGLVLGLFIRSGLAAMADRGRTVAVRGLSEREVEANKVTWPVVYKLVGNDLPSLYGQIESNNSEIVSYLKSNGLSDDDYTIMAPDLTDKQADMYNSQVLTYRYSVSSGVIVTSEKVETVRKLINRQGELLKKGIAVVAGDYQYRTIYEYTDLNAIKPEMIADATQKAREAAEKFAQDSGSKVGKIMSASQGQFSIEDRDPYTPFIKKIRVVTSLNFSLSD